MKKILLFILLVSIPVECFASKYNTEIMANASKYLGVRENTNRNDHPEIDRWLLDVGLDNKALTSKGKQGYSYCAAFVHSMLKQSYAMRGEKSKHLRSARVVDNWKNAKKDKFTYTVTPAKHVLIGAYKLHPADVIIWSNKKTDDNWNGHTGFVVRQVSDSKFKAIEGNTGASNKASEQREQYGVSTKLEQNGGVRLKDRSIDPYSSFLCEGFIRIND